MKSQYLLERYCHSRKCKKVLVLRPGETPRELSTRKYCNHQCYAEERMQVSLDRDARRKQQGPAKPFPYQGPMMLRFASHEDIQEANRHDAHQFMHHEVMV